MNTPPMKEPAAGTVFPASTHPLWPQMLPPHTRVPHTGFVRFDNEKLMHDEHYHECNEWYFIAGGMARLRLGDKRPLVGRGDVVLIPKGLKHDILETYGEEPFALFYLYEPEGGVALSGHLHADDFSGPHAVPHLPLRALDETTSGVA